MDPKTTEFVKADFLSWSGGFPPESDYQITVYIDYVGPVGTDPDEVREFLTDWMCDPTNCDHMTAESMRMD
jgi:hypothetical protein